VSALRDFLLAPPPGGAPLADAQRGGGPRSRSAGRGARVSLGARLSWGGREAAEPARADAFPGLGAGVAPAAVAVLCAAEDARAVGVATAVLLARRARTPCGLACIWTAPDPHHHPEARPPASRGARRLAAVLEGRGLDACACGRAAVVALPEDAGDAARGLARATAAAGHVPVVLVLGGPRAAGFDEVLAAQDRLLVVTRPGADAAIQALAVAGLPAGGPPHEGCTIGFGPLARALAAAGLATPAVLRRALEGGGGGYAGDRPSRPTR